MNPDDTPQLPKPYRLSGAITGGPLLPILSTLVGVVMGYVLGVTNAGMLSISMKLELLFMFVSGTVIGGATAGIAKFIRCRNAKWVYGSVLLGSLVSVHAYCVGTVSTSLAHQGTPTQELSLWLSPIAVFQATFNWNVFLILEQLFLIGTALMIAWKMFHRQIHCEMCGQWLNLADSHILLPNPKSRAGIDAFKAGNLEHVANHPDDQSSRQLVAPFVRLNYIICPGCGNTGAYRLVLVQYVSEGLDKKRTERPLCPVMCLDEISTQHLAVLLNRTKIVSAPVKKLPLKPRKTNIPPKAP